MNKTKIISIGVAVATVILAVYTFQYNNFKINSDSKKEASLSDTKAHLSSKDIEDPKPNSMKDLAYMLVQQYGNTSQEKSRSIPWFKAGFSLIFGLAALYIILSQKYPGDIQRWAFSILTLISGVWIGTAA